MKIKPEHYEYMKSAILGNAKAPTLPDYLAKGLTEKRWRWDLFYMANLSRWVCDNVYSYANDDHIDTALRNILRCP